MKYFGKYNTDSDVQNALDSGELNKPYVALVSGTTLDYNSKIPSIEVPLTFNVTSSGNVVWWDYNQNHPLQYSKNGGQWTNTSGSSTTISVVSGDTVQFRGNNQSYNDGYEGFSNTDCNFTLSGNIMSLLSATSFGELTSVPVSGLTFLFFMCGGLTDASELIMPATDLSEYCYYGLFQECISLTKAPVLPAQALAEGSYRQLFVNCPLTYIKCLATDISATDCLYQWVLGVPSTCGSSSSSSSTDAPPFEGGTFVKAASMEDWEFGESGIPCGWTVEDDA